MSHSAWKPLLIYEPFWITSVSAACCKLNESKMQITRVWGVLSPDSISADADRCRNLQMIRETAIRIITDTLCYEEPVSEEINHLHRTDFERGSRFRPTGISVCSQGRPVSRDRRHVICRRFMTMASSENKTSEKNRKRQIYGRRERKDDSNRQPGLLTGCFC